jgi:hypothetical protein
MKLRLPWPLRNPSPIFQTKATALEPKVNFSITDGAIELTSNLSANALNVDGDGVQLHCQNLHAKPRKQHGQRMGSAEYCKYVPAGENQSNKAYAGDRFSPKGKARF